MIVALKVFLIQERILLQISHQKSIPKPNGNVKNFNIKEEFLLFLPSLNYPIF
jgi:hypothetical protein